MVNQHKIYTILFLFLFLASCSEKEKSSTSSNVDITILSPKYSLNSLNQSQDGEIINPDTMEIINHKHDISISAKSKSGIQSFELLLIDPQNDQKIITIDSLESYDPYVQEFNTAYYSDNIYTLVAIAVNGEDSVGTDTVKFHIMNESFLPRVEILNIPQDTVVFGNINIRVNAKSVEKIGDTYIEKDEVRYVQIQLNDIVKVDSIAPYEFFVNLMPFKNGKYSLIAKAVDYTGLGSKDEISIEVNNQLLYPDTVNFIQTYYNITKERADFYWMHKDDSLRYKIYFSDNADFSNPSIVKSNYVLPTSIPDSAHMYIENYKADQIQFFQMEVCNADSFCTKGSISRFSSLVTFEQELNEISEITDVEYLSCGTADCFSVVGGGKTNEGLHRTYNMNGDHSFSNQFSLVEETIGDGRGSQLYRFPKSLIIADNNYYITGNIGQNDSTSLSFLSIENDQGFSAFSFEEFNKGFGVELSTNNAKDYVVGGTFIDTSYVKYPFFSTFSSSLVQDNSKSFTDTVRRFIDSTKAQVILNTALSATDGGFIASGHYETISRKELYIHKYDQSGQISWIYRSHQDSSFFSSIHSLIELPNGEIIGVGFIEQAKQSKTLIVKLSSTGQFQWSSYFNQGVEGNKVITTDSGDIIVAGTSSDYKGSLMKLDSGGRQLWIREYLNFRKINSVAQINNGGYVIVGSSISNNGILKKVGPMGENE